MSVKIGVIVGTTRPGRVGRKIADWFMDLVNDTPGATFELIDLSEVNLPFLDEPDLPSNGNYQHEHTKKWSETVAKYDGYVWVTAEYNHGYPAPLKNAIDTVYGEWARKPVAFVGYGGFGAARSIEQLVNVAAQLHMVPLQATTLNVLDVWSALDENGIPKPELVRGRPERLVDNLIWWAKVLQAARNAEEA